MHRVQVQQAFLLKGKSLFLRKLNKPNCESQETWLGNSIVDLRGKTLEEQKPHSYLPPFSLLNEIADLCVKSQPGPQGASSKIPHSELAVKMSSVFTKAEGTQHWPLKPP